MKVEVLVHCGKCLEPILSGEAFVCFKIPGKGGYLFFHCRRRAEDCWERHLIESANVQ